MGMGGMPGMSPFGVPGMGMPMGGGMAMGGGLPGMGMGPPGFGGGMPGMGGMPGFGPPPGLPTGPPLPEGVPPPPGIGGATGADKQFTGEGAFTDFMAAFRTEMREARDQGDRKQKFVPSKTAAESKRAALERRAEQIFGVGVGERDDDDALAGAEDFDEWPDEFLLLGVAEGDAEAGSSPSPDSDTSTTSTTASDTEETDTEETDYEDEDAWPIEMLIG